MKIYGIIPARFGSTRFPGKILHPIAGKPLVQHVVERCEQVSGLSGVIVATDDARIMEVVQGFCEVEMTQPDHPSGTDRIAEVAARLECDAVVNVQGDEPLIDPAVIERVAQALERCDMSTAATRITSVEEWESPNVVKVVRDTKGCALYFSRRTIPYLRDQQAGGPEAQLEAFPFLKHIGIYGYRKPVLERIVKLPQSPLEMAEKLEQLRALENGIEIAVEAVDYDSLGVDVPGDVARVEAILRKRE